MFRSQFSVYQRRVDLKEEDRIALLEQWKNSGAKPEITGWWNVQIQLDSQNGDDSNDGQSAPVKTLSRAVELIPTGGVGLIKFLSDYTLSTANELINIEEKKVYFYGSGKSYSLTVNQDGGASAFRGSGIFIFSSFNELRFNFNYDTSTPIFWPTFRYLGEATSLLQKVIITTCNKVVLSDNSGTTTTKFLMKADVQCSAATVEIDSTSIKFLDCSGLTTRFSTSGVSLVDSSGNALSWGDYISGIVKDANGVPRNIVSNIVL